MRGFIKATVGKGRFELVRVGAIERCVMELADDGIEYVVVMTSSCGNVRTSWKTFTPLVRRILEAEGGE